MNEEYGMLVSFPDQSESFVLGFEAGQCWQSLSVGSTEDVLMLIHMANQEVIRRIASNFNYSVEFTAAADGWCLAGFTRARPKFKPVLIRALEP